MRSTPEHVARYLKPHLSALGVEVNDDDKLVAVVKAQQERAKTLKEMAQNSLFFFRELSGYDEKAANKVLNAQSVPALTEAHAKLSALPGWTAAALHEAVNQVAAQLGVGLGKVAQPIRVAVSGTTVSPPIDVTLEVLGRETTLARLAAALEYAKSKG
jgi:glutamyl-tRNA synthetase